MSLSTLVSGTRVRGAASSLRGRVGGFGRGTILDQYVKRAPSPQNALDLFAGEWASELPGAELNSGRANLFDDARVLWALEQFGDIDGWRVLELGPLEGGHTFMLANAGAHVKAVESHARAYLKCLVAKEVLGGYAADFVLGDFMEYLRETDERFDLCFASGVLYHLTNPVEAIELAARTAKRLFLWTHYYDDAVASTDAALQARFTGAIDHNHAGFRHTLHVNNYRHAVNWNRFCGGSSPTSAWLSRADLLGALDHFGWHVDALAFDEPDHPNGPALGLIAHRK